MIVILGTPEWLRSRAPDFFSRYHPKTPDCVPHWAICMEHASPSACVSASLSFMDYYHSGEHIGLRIRTQTPAICIWHICLLAFHFFYFLLNHNLPLWSNPSYIWMIIFLGTPDCLSSGASSFISGHDLRSCNQVPHLAPCMEHFSASACISVYLSVFLIED